MLFAAPPSLAGSITATVKTAEPIRKVWAVQLQFTAAGVYPKPIEGKIVGDRVTLADLPTPGRYDLQFDTDSGMVMGWDAAVPPSDYVQEQPLGDEAKRIVLKKMTNPKLIAFPDVVVVLDIQGNAQNAAVLLTTLRTRTFAESAGPNSDTWIWRVDRWQWEFPDETTWVPWQERPYYAVVRERLKPEAYKTKRVVFARHLGGIELIRERPERDMGIIFVPKPTEGIHAINPDGSPTKPITLKPRPMQDRAAGDDPVEPKE